MTVLVVVLYLLAAACELAGVSLAAVEVRNARIMWTQRINAPATPEEGPAYGLSRAQQGLEELFVGGRVRRIISVALLAGGVLMGAAGNLTSLARG